MPLRVAQWSRMLCPLLAVAILSAGLSGCAGISPQASGPSSAESPAPATTSPATSTTPAATSTATETLQSPPARPTWDPDACPNGAIGEHSDWIEEFAFDTPEEAVLEQPRDAPDGERVLIEDGKDEQVWVVVDDTGTVIAELRPSRTANGRWAVYDYSWCQGMQSQRPG